MKTNVLVELVNTKTNNKTYLITVIKNNNYYEWADGNYSCDCNRAIIECGNWNVQCGNEAYSVTIFNINDGSVLYKEEK